MLDARRAIPSVERLLGSPAFAPLLAALPRARVIAMLQREQTDVRSAHGVADTGAIATAEYWAERVRTAIAADDVPSLRAVINATGVVLHTNLGRAPLASAAVQAMQLAATGYTNLEYDLAAGKRGSRYDHCAQLLCELTGAEAALVVNNNAAALVLALGTLAHGRNVIVSRGELVEIGDGFRIPEICARSGALLREVGATNRTHLRDYADALDNGGVLLKVHPSNYRIAGFAQDVSIDELARLARSTDTPLVHDLGSGLLIDAQLLGLPHEPRPHDALAAGADIVTMSGDKLLGGPQAGILLGRADLIARMRKDPLCRALRVDKLTLAALEATLRLYRDPQRALAEIPALRMIAMPAGEIETRTRALSARLAAVGIVADVVPSACTVGGGAFPEVEIPSHALRVHGNAVQLEAQLRNGAQPVIARVHDDALHLELRTVLPDQDAQLERALVAAVT